MPDFVKAKPIPSQIKFRRTKIDPILAQKWLDTRELNNRTVRKTKVRNDAADMLAGRWYENGDVIRLAPDGELLDGMHRLHSIIQANCEIMLWVAYDVPKEAMGSIDIGAARNFADYLKMSGEHACVVQAGITRRLYAWSRGSRMYEGGRVYPSMVVLRDVHARQRDEIRFAAKIGDDIRRHTQFLKVTWGGFFYLLTSAINEDQATEFKDRVIDGDGLLPENPITALRRRLFGYGARDLTDYDRLAMFIHAWNLWRIDEPAETIYKVYTASGKGSNQPLTNDNFPEPC